MCVAARWLTEQGNRCLAAGRTRAADVLWTTPTPGGQKVKRASEFLFDCFSIYFSCRITGAVPVAEMTPLGVYLYIFLIALHVYKKKIK